MTNEIFSIPVRRCQRCGGLLTSEFGLKNGMGHVCKKKYDIEHQPIDENQMTLDSMEENDVPTGKGPTETAHRSEK